MKTTKRFSGPADSIANISGVFSVLVVFSLMSNPNSWFDFDGIFEFKHVLTQFAMPSKA
jgi:hypothetical protein